MLCRISRNYTIQNLERFSPNRSEEYPLGDDSFVVAYAIMTIEVGLTISCIAVHSTGMFPR